jgi:glutamate formiminotransferase/formiminotetrahydrofolate cyclodeaminase
VGVAGSEIVGVVPLEAILMAADYYIEKENLFILDEDQKVRLAIERLGLNSVAPFNPREKIIEYVVAEPPDEPLADMPVRGFIKDVASRSSAPGGGSVAALLTALGTGLGSMTAKLTFGVRKFENLDRKMREIIPPLHTASQALIPMIDADTNAFAEYMEGLRMPKDTTAEKAARTAKMQAGLKTAIRVPLKTMQLGDQAWEAMCSAARHGNMACKSDLQVGARALETGIWGAYQNVLINMTGIKDEAFKAEILAAAEAAAVRAREKCTEVLAILEQRKG